MTAAFLYSAILCYTGIRGVTGAERTRSLIAFVLLAAFALIAGTLLFTQGGK
jgi:hypothetical protein